MDPVNHNSRVVRCNRKGPTPYLASLDATILRAVKEMRAGNKDRHIRIVDVGAGSGDNMHYVRSLIKGPKSCKGYDLDPADSYIEKIDLVYQDMPEQEESVDVILCQYSLMFIPEYRLEEVLTMLHEMADDKAILVFEAFQAKQGYYPTLRDLSRLIRNVNTFFFSRGWSLCSPGCQADKKVFVKNTPKEDPKPRTMPDSGSLRTGIKKTKKDT